MDLKNADEKARARWDVAGFFCMWPGAVQCTAQEMQGSKQRIRRSQEILV